MRQLRPLEVAGGLMLLYLALTAATAALGGAIGATQAAFVVWIGWTVCLFLCLLGLGALHGAFDDALRLVLVLLAALVGAAFGAYVGLVLLVNIWQALGIHH